MPDSSNKRPRPRVLRDRTMSMEHQVAAKQERKLRAHREGHRSVWFGLGMMGLIGWSVAIPAVVGVAIGLWIDSRWPGDYSWALMLLILGMAIGCLNAWNWVQREGRTDRDDHDDVSGSSNNR